MDIDYDDMTKFADTFNVIDNSGQPVRCHKNGGRGYISPWVAAYPKHDLQVWDLLEAGKYDEAQAEKDRVGAAIGPWGAKTGAKSGGYRQMKGIMAAMGNSVGPPRPPTPALLRGRDRRGQGSRGSVVLERWLTCPTPRLPSAV